MNEAMGVYLFGDNDLKSAENTSMTIAATSTGAGSVTVAPWDMTEEVLQSVDRNNSAGAVHGLNAEGGVIDLKGDTSITATGNGAFATGMILQAFPQDTYDNVEDVRDFGLKADFGGDLTVTASSQTGGAVGIRLGGYVPETNSSYGDEYTSDVKVVMTTHGTTTITAETGNADQESVGILFDYPSVGDLDDPVIDTPEEFEAGRGYLYLNGTTTVTADHALQGEIGYLTNTGNLTLNGRVDQFKGEFTQTAGSTVLNDETHGFFGGLVTLAGGTLTADNAVFETTKTNKLVVSGGVLTIGALTVSSNEDFEFTDGTITVTGTPVTEGNAFVVRSNVAASGDTALILQASGDIQGTLSGVGAVTATLDANESFNVEGELVVGKDLTIQGGSFTNMGDIELGGNLILENVTALNGDETGEPHGDIDLLNGTLDLRGNTRLTNWGGLHSKNIKLGGTSVYMEEDEGFEAAADGGLKLTLAEDGTLEFAGGRLSTIGSNGEAEITEIVIANGENEVPDDPAEGNPATDSTQVVFSAGGYTLSSVTIARDPSTLGDESLFTFEVRGGNQTVHTLTATQGRGGVTGGNLTVDELRLAESGAFKVTGGTMTVDTITFGDGTGTLTVAGGELTTTSDQIFANGLNEEGSTLATGGIREDGRFDFTGGTIAFNDEFYNDWYSADASSVLGSGVKIVFNGQLNQAGPSGDMDIEDIPESGDVIHSNVDAVIKDGGSTTVDKAMGVSSIKVQGDATSVTIDSEGNVTLVGGNDGENPKEIIAFAGEGEHTVAVDGSLTLGAAGSTNNQGQLTAKVDVATDGTFAVDAGNFVITDVTTKGTVSVTGGSASFGTITADGGKVALTGGTTTVDTLTLTNGSTLDASSDTTTKVANLAVGDGEHTLTGTVDVQEVRKTEFDADGIVRVGNNSEEASAKGVLNLHSDTMQGLKFFLDPLYVDGQEITDGSRFTFAGTNLDGQIEVGENSSLVLGSADGSALDKVFADGVLSWGNKEGDVLAAVYVAKAITIDQEGALYVDGDLKAWDDSKMKGGTATFAANSALVADVSDLTSDTVPITADNVTVEEGAKAVLVGDLKQNIGYKLSEFTDANLAWAKNLVAGNAMWKLDADENDGTISATLQDADLVYGDNMQGTALANAGMLASGAEYDYVNALLTDASGNISALASVAERFDAAMNAAGALAVWTTAYDRASDLRRVVREETAVAATGPRLWAQVTGGKTKLNGLSTGARSIDVDTDAYGLVVGGESSFDTWKLGAAFTAGTGDTENDSVDAKDDFDFYGVSFYGKKSVDAYDFLFDVAGTWVKSDLTVGGVADVDTDTTTTVWSLGAEVRRTADLGWANLTPFVGANVYYVESDGFSNGHGARVDDTDATAVEFPIGAELAKAFKTSGGMGVTSAFSLAVVPTVGDTDVDSTVRFAGASSDYNFTFTDDVKVRSNLSIFGETKNFAFGAKVGYEWGDEERSATTFSLNAAYRF